MTNSEKPIRILYVDDNILDRELVRDSLTKENTGFELIETAAKEDFINKIETEKFDLVLTDFNILGFLGLEVIEKVKAVNTETPVIIVTGTGSEEIAVEAMRKGAADYVIKTEKHIRRLPETILKVVERARLEKENEKLEERLNQNQKLESLGVLAGGIAHDFNNLLGGIFGYVELAIKESSREKRDIYLSKTIATIDRARGLTMQLLTFAKGGAPIKKIEELMPFVKDSVQFALSGSPVSPHFEIQNDLWLCELDKNQIGQVIDNIVINAIHSMPNGGTIDVNVKNMVLGEKKHPILKPGRYVKISIRDTGTGISEAHMQKIFDPFYSTKSNGHGLGLTTSYSIINRHGGCIDVESELGKGATFHIFLPATTASSLANIEDAANAHKGSGIFIVMDDEDVMRESIGGILEIFGYSSLLTENGEEAIKCFQAIKGASHSIAGMIFDLTVPGKMGGIETVAEIRKLGFKEPIFVTSGYANDPVMADPLKYGFTASICKPFMSSDIAKLLNEHLKTTK